jgi:hypothetical protein
MRDCGSNSLNHSVEGGDCCGGARGGGRGATSGMNEDSTYYTGKSYWGANSGHGQVEGQSGCSGHGQVEGQSGGCAHGGGIRDDAYRGRQQWLQRPRAAAVAKGPAVPVAGLAPTTEKGRSTEGWGHTTVVALAAMPTRARATTVTPVTRSWEEEAA